ncbi:hypothetical protein GcM3_192034 [Golovinomyces cichoracearum]|uniref:Uncharacterized protein n=1 Tax=Golovinomyces cichoracearum TaxID=62708 RepID=A0A420HHK4_9PEZI|nr:hypothetical protein GcM3_192034 [Golovinomyces cichoracearum]
MVYDWEDKEEVCYRMYIEEKKSLEEIMEYMKVHHKFNPSKRAFQTQFKKWDFPSKQHPAHKNAALVRRVKELWDCNTSQREMLLTLNEEGFDIKERELMRVRAKNRWLLRVPNGLKSRKKAPEQDVISQLQQALFAEGSLLRTEVDDKTLGNISIQTSHEISNRPASPPLSPEVMKKRQERLKKLQAESAERWALRKRRRRTRGWAGLPADPPGPPRFPSETTIDESKAFLSLDSRLYRDIRSRFQRICEDAAIIKKTVAGPERWEAAKDRLIQESLHLQSVFWVNEENQDLKKLALDVVCSDVTKRMRTLERRMTIAEAKNTLHINPEESRQLRNAFYQVLKADHFTSKLEAGEEHWKDLKNQWINGSELLQNILAPGEADTHHQEKLKAIEVLCRDVMKRLRDDQTKRDPLRRINTKNSSPKVVGECGESTMPNLEQSSDTFYSRDITQSQNEQNHSTADEILFSRQQFNMNSFQVLLEVKPAPILSQTLSHEKDIVDTDMQIDPSLLTAAPNNPLIDNRNF